MTLCERLEVVELGEEIEAACSRAVRTAIRELSQPLFKVHQPPDDVQQMLAQIEALRTTGNEPVPV